MKSLIINEFENQPLKLRVIWKTMTTLAWGFWLYLWSPLILLAAAHLGITNGIANANGERMLQVLITTLGGHLSMVSIAISIFIAWALLSHFGANSVYAYTLKNPPKQLYSTSSANLVQAKLKNCPHFQRIVVFHDENSGQLQNVEINFVPIIYRTARSVPCNNPIPHQVIKNLKPSTNITCRKRHL